MDKDLKKNSKMIGIFRVIGDLNGNSCVLFTTDAYIKAEIFCLKQDCPFELHIRRYWVNKSKEIKFDSLKEILT